MGRVRQPNRTGEGHAATGASERAAAPDPESLTQATAGSPRPESDPLAAKAARFASLLYEGILLIPILFLAAYLFLAIARDAQTPLTHHLFQAWLLLVMGMYFVYCWRRGGQTLPMKTWRLRLARADRGSVTLTQAWLRYALAVAGLLLLGVGFLWAFLDRDGQFLHDRIAGTRIFRVPKDRSEGRRKD